MLYCRERSLAVVGVLQGSSAQPADEMSSFDIRLVVLLQGAQPGKLLAAPHQGTEKQKCSEAERQMLWSSWAQPETLYCRKHSQAVLEILQGSSAQPQAVIGRMVQKAELCEVQQGQHGGQEQFRNYGSLCAH